MELHQEAESPHDKIPRPETTRRHSTWLILINSFNLSSGFATLLASVKRNILACHALCRLGRLLRTDLEELDHETSVGLLTALEWHEMCGPANNANVFRIAMERTTITCSHFTPGRRQILPLHPSPWSPPYCSASTRPTLTLPQWDPQPLRDLQAHI